MKCEFCPAYQAEGYEYPIYYCQLGIDEIDTIEFKDGFYGCKRKSLKKIYMDLERERNLW